MNRRDAAHENELEKASTTEGLPISPSMGPSLALAKMPTHTTPVDPRTVYLSAVAVVIGLAAGYAAILLIKLIFFITNLAFFHILSFRLATEHGAPDNHLGAWVIAVPVIGGLIIGLLLKYGSRALAGHGIPEAMEVVLVNQSRIPPKMTFMKPLSAAISIGTGAPYGPEGPIIATGGAVGSLVGQLLHTTAAERKTLLAAGAAAGIAAAFGSPIAAVLLAIELLLFEFRPRSIIPVAFAAAVATVIHFRFEGGAKPMFPFSGAPVLPASEGMLAMYALLGCFVGVGAVILTRTVYAIEHFFEHLPIHWMWHPAIGALAVGIIGWRLPRTLGPGYFNITDMLSSGFHGHPGAIVADLTFKGLVLLLVLKFLIWEISLGSGTVGGTLAPVFTIGGALGAVLAVGMNKLLPQAAMDVRVAALVGMVAIFAGASRAMLTCIVFGLETTMQPWAVLPVVCGCAAAYLVSALIMRHSIMTEKMAKSGVRVPAEFVADFLDQVLVTEVMSREPVTLDVDQTLAQVREWIDTGAEGTFHQGYPLVDRNGLLVGVLTRRDLLNPKKPENTVLRTLLHRPPVLVYSDCTLRDAADHMVNHDIGRLPVIDRASGGKVIGMVTRSDLLAAHRRRLREASHAHQAIRLWGPSVRRLRAMRGRAAESAPSKNGAEPKVEDRAGV